MVVAPSKSKHLSWLKTENQTATPGVYVSLNQLVRYRFKATGFSFLPKQPVHSILSGRHASRIRGRGLSFEEIREYHFGDDIRAMDWRVTARTLQPHIRVYSEERDRSCFFVVDQRINMFFGSVRDLKSVSACHAAALGSWRSLGQGDRVGGCVFNDKKIDMVKPLQSEHRLHRLLNVMVSFNHDLHVNQKTNSNAKQLNNALSLAIKELKHDGLCCIITDAFGFDEHTEQLLDELSAKNDVLWGLVVDPLEKRLPNSGHFVAGDATGQLHVQLSRKIQQQFLQAAENRFHEIEARLQKRQIPMLYLATDRPVENQIREQLGFVPKVPRR